jgi:hypothetical protein
VGREGRGHPGDTQEEEGILVKCGKWDGHGVERVERLVPSRLWRDFRLGLGVDGLRYPNVKQAG